MAGFEPRSLGWVPQTSFKQFSIELNLNGFYLRLFFQNFTLHPKFPSLFVHQIEIISKLFILILLTSVFFMNIKILFVFWVLGMERNRKRREWEREREWVRVTVRESERERLQERVRGTVRETVRETVRDIVKEREWERDSERQKKLKKKVDYTAMIS